MRNRDFLALHRVKKSAPCAQKAHHVLNNRPVSSGVNRADVPHQVFVQPTMNLYLASHRRAERQLGFTLIEVMIVAAIVAILAAVALPAYNQYTLRGQVSSAFSQMSATAVSMQQYYQDNRTFLAVGALTPPCGAAAVTIGNFSYACNGSTAVSFVITATGAGPAAGFTFTLDNNNNKATPYTGPGSGWPTSTACWVRDKAGDCN